jgi:ketosteroid isomerase-like protein
MDPNEQIISNFYHSFQRLDAQGMNSCYSDDIVFFDPVFELLQADQARAMWRMLCGNAKDFSLTYGNIKALDEEYYTCDWVATYTFSQTGKRVVNNVKAHMKMLDGKIVEHSDGFSLHKWSTQALGFPGWLLGWNSFFQRNKKNNARKTLLQYMQKEAE